MLISAPAHQHKARNFAALVALKQRRLILPNPAKQIHGGNQEAIQVRFGFCRRHHRPDERLLHQPLQLHIRTRGQIPGNVDYQLLLRAVRVAADLRRFLRAGQG